MKTLRFQVTECVVTNAVNSTWPDVRIKLQQVDEHATLPPFFVDEMLLSDMPYTDDYPIEKGMLGYEFEMVLKPIGKPQGSFGAKS